MLDTETSLRTLHAYVGVLQGRLVLARATGSRREFAAVSDSQLAQVADLCTHAATGIDAMLDRLAPGLASNAAAVADLSCRRELDLPRPPDAAHLHLVAVEADRPG